MKTKILLFFTILLVGVFIVNVYSASLSDLLRVGRSQDEIQDALKSETKNYNKISGAVADNEIKKGMLKEDIFNKYGQPSVIVKADEGQTKAVYKPSNKSYFDNEKVTLIFDENNILLNILLGQN